MISVLFPRARDVGVIKLIRIALALATGTCGFHHPGRGETNHCVIAQKNCNLFTLGARRRIVCRGGGINARRARSTNHRCYPERSEGSALAHLASTLVDPLLVAAFWVA